MFIHFGAHSAGGRGEWIANRERIGKDEYTRRYVNSLSTWHYDPESRAELAVESGMGYGVLTAQHQDGFALWPTRAGDFHAGPLPTKSFKWNSPAKTKPKTEAPISCLSMFGGVLFSKTATPSGPAFSRPFSIFTSLCEPREESTMTSPSIIQGRSYEIAPTKRSTVPVIHHPNRCFWVCEHSAKTYGPWF
jgi:hypothetical protein